MSIDYKVYQDSILFYIFGELDEFSANKIRGEIDKIIENNLTVKKVVFDFSKLNFMDSTGIGLLIGRYKKLNGFGIKCYIENPKPSVQKILELSGIYGLMPKIG